MVALRCIQTGIVAALRIEHQIPYKTSSSLIGRGSSSPLIDTTVEVLSVSYYDITPLVTNVR